MKFERCIRNFDNIKKIRMTYQFSQSLQMLNIQIIQNSEKTIQNNNYVIFLSFYRPFEKSYNYYLMNLLHR